MKYVPNARVYDEQVTLKSVEFCTRERSLPYVKMVHGRLLITLLDSNIECGDLNCVFLIVEATIHLLKNILTKLFNRKANRDSTCKHLDYYFGNNFYYSKQCEASQLKNSEKMESDSGINTEDDDEAKTYKKDLEIINSQSIGLTHQPFTLFELKELLQVDLNCTFAIHEP
jgi:hypothetical protein